MCTIYTVMTDWCGGAKRSETDKAKTDMENKGEGVTKRVREVGKEAEDG